MILNIRFVLYGVVRFGKTRNSRTRVRHCVYHFGAQFSSFVGRFQDGVWTNHEYYHETRLFAMGNLVSFFVLRLFFSVEQRQRYTSFVGRNVGTTVTKGFGRSITIVLVCVGSFTSGLSLTRTRFYTSFNSFSKLTGTFPRVIFLLKGRRGFGRNANSFFGTMGSYQSGAYII